MLTLCINELMYYLTEARSTQWYRHIVMREDGRLFWSNVTLEVEGQTGEGMTWKKV